MYESFGFETLTAPQAVVWFGLALGLVFGALAQQSRFCLRRSVVTPGGEGRAARGTWAMGLIAAVLGTQAAVAAGWISFEEHRLLNPDLPLLAIVAGGLMFGVGMVLSRGCISRLTVLTGQGNLRALIGILVFALVAHATLKGVLAPVRVAVGSVTVPMGEASTLAALPGGAAMWSALIGLAAAAFVWRAGARKRDLVMGAAIGLLVPLGWVGTGYVLYDDFDPIALESLSFTAPAADSLFYVVASSAISPTFGAGLVGGTILGAAIAALLTRQTELEGFDSTARTGRMLAGAALMGAGGVLAGGCTLGAGLAGIPTLGVAALTAFGSIVLGARLAVSVPARGPVPVPAE